MPTLALKLYGRSSRTFWFGCSIHCFPLDSQTIRMLVLMKSSSSDAMKQEHAHDVDRSYAPFQHIRCPNAGTKPCQAEKQGQDCSPAIDGPLGKGQQEGRVQKWHAGPTLSCLRAWLRTAGSASPAHLERFGSATRVLAKRVPK